MLERLYIKSEQREKKGFHASDYGKSALDLFFAFKGITKTNAPAWYDQVKWGAGSGAEIHMLKALVDSGFVDEGYDQDFDGRIEFKINDEIPVSGYMDAVMKNSEPVEIKTINNKNSWDIKKYEDNNPRENYVGQLSIYQHFQKSKIGHLFVCSIDGLNRFWFDNVMTSNGVYECGNTKVDLNKEFDRWSKIWKITKEFKPTKKELVPKEFLWEYRYKFPVKDVGWTKVSQADIIKARNNHAVYGDWQIKYSDWSDLIINLQNETKGYTLEELEIIKEKTKGYTTWKK